MALRYYPLSLQENQSLVKGRIYLVPNTLGGNSYTHVIPSDVVETIKRLRYFVVEEIRSTRRYLRMIDKSFPIDESLFYELNEHSNDSDVEPILQVVLDGHDVGVISEAGLPCIADPGAIFVKQAHAKGIIITPLCGPSSIILSLISSGFNGQNFTFNGYLPINMDERVNRLKEIERRANQGNTQIFMETPYRNQKLLETILSTFRNETMLCIAVDVTLPSEEIKTMSISKWKKNVPNLKDRLVIFVTQ